MRDYRLALEAQLDLDGIQVWTEEHFGLLASERYDRLIDAAVRDIAADPHRVGSVPHREFASGVRSWHLRLSRHHVPPLTGIVGRPRHRLIYHVEPGRVVIDRVLHDSMDMKRHLGDLIT